MLVEDAKPLSASISFAVSRGAARETISRPPRARSGIDLNPCTIANAKRCRNGYGFLWPYRSLAEYYSALTRPAKDVEYIRYFTVG